MAYKVLKPIPKGNGETIPTGTLVDAAKWRNLRTLISGRFLVEVVDAIAVKPVVASAPKAVVVEVQTPVEVQEEKPRSVRRSRKRDESEE